MYAIAPLKNNAKFLDSFSSITVSIEVLYLFKLSSSRHSKVYRCLQLNHSKYCKFYRQTEVIVGLELRTLMPENRFCSCILVFVSSSNS